MKLNRRGKATILTAAEFSSLLAATNMPAHRLLYQVAYWTGERIGAVRQLRVEDVYCQPKRGGKLVPREVIHYRREIRKGELDDRQVPVHKVLKQALTLYTPPAEGYLFPGRLPGCCLTGVTVDQNLRNALERAGLKDRGISTHSFRRTFLTNLARRGTSRWVLQKISGHRDPKCLDEYIEVNEDQVRQAVMAL